MVFIITKMTAIKTRNGYFDPQVKKEKRKKKKLVYVIE